METFHDMIHTNLCLLKEKGHKISFEEGMFQYRNQPGFEKVGYALLAVIDPNECKKKIPWPLCNDKTRKNDFRIKFVKFIKMINEKYPDAQVPEMTTSNLQHPGGEKFLRFMFKLSTFALLLELQRITSTEQQNKFLLHPEYPKGSQENGIKLNIMRGARCHMEHSTGQYAKLEAAAIPKLQKLKTISNGLASEVNTIKVKLENEIKSLSKEEDLKKRLHDTEDQDVMSEWNHRTEEKIKELERSCHKLYEVRDLTAKSCQLVKAVEKTRTDTLCLDGSLLIIPPAVSELASSPVMNTRGQVRLQVLLEAGAEAARKLAPSPHPAPQSPLLPLARNLLIDVRQQGATAREITQFLLNLCAESKEAIEKRIPVICAKMKKKEVLDHFKFVADWPPLQFICEDSVPKMFSPLEKRKQMPLHSLANLHLEKGRKVICSVRRRRSVSKYSFEQTPRHPLPHSVYQTTAAPRLGFRVPSTCISQKTSIASAARPTARKSIVAPTMSKWMLKNPKPSPDNRNSGTARTKHMKVTPACKRSIYGKLPTGFRAQAEDDFAKLLSTDPLSHLISANSFSETSGAIESQKSSALTADASNTEEFEVASPPKKPRKSLLDIVERYKKIRASILPFTPNTQPIV